MKQIDNATAVILIVLLSLCNTTQAGAAEKLQLAQISPDELQSLKLFQESGDIELSTEEYDPFFVAGSLCEPSSECRSVGVMKLNGKIIVSDDVHCSDVNRNCTYKFTSLEVSLVRGKKLKHLEGGTLFHARVDFTQSTGHSRFEAMLYDLD